MNLIKQLIIIFLIICTPFYVQAAPVCDADPNVIKLLKEMVDNKELSEVIKDSPELAKLWQKMGAEDLVDAWTVLESDAKLRKDRDNILRIHAFIEFAINQDSNVKNKDQAIKNLTKSFKSQRTDNDKKKWVALKHTQAVLESKYASMSQNPPPKLTPWTKEHKAQRWNNYKEGGGDKSYVAWSNIYDGNINKSKRADEAAKEYAKTLSGDVKHEQTSVDTYDIKLSHNGRNQNITGKRRHDILDGDDAYEIKDYRSSKVNLSADIEREVLMDVAMLDAGAIDSITWVFTKHPDGKGRPSQPLLDLLNNHNINVEYRNP